MSHEPTRIPDELDAELAALIDFERAVADVLALFGRGDAR
jgi:hypothetical protein